MAYREQKILLRVQSPDGTKRIEVPELSNSEFLLRLVGEAFGLPGSGSTWRLFRDRAKTPQSQIFMGRQMLQQLGLRQGDMLYLDFLPDAKMDVSSGLSPLEIARQRTGSSFSSALGVSPLTKDRLISEAGSPRSSESAPTADIVEDEVDQLLWQQSGAIERPKDERMCKHGASGKCIYCIPIEPFDEEYLQSRNPPIKHMSFHAYLRKLTSGATKGKFAALSEVSCRIKPGCPSHLPWPEGICTKCQPSALTLNRQRYRHVDSIMFENAELVERFLDYWRRTGLQRVGILYGKYEQHKDVPLGIRATVAAVYEPPQLNSENSLELQEDPNGEVIDCVAGKMGLRRVGWIFTDLVAEDVRAGTVKFLRNKDTYFLTAEECITAGTLQCQNPNPCKLSPTGQFGSKFVTVVVTGDNTNHIHFEGYQVSEQCMSLVRDNCLVPTYDAPELAYVKESTSQQYVPDVFYKEKDNYGNEVTRLARPLPVEYLIVDLPVSMPKEPKYTFKLNDGKTPFPVENRLDQKQDFATLIRYASQFRSFLDVISDFHVLLFMATTEDITLQDDELEILAAAVINKDASVANDWAAGSAYWQAVQRFVVTPGQEAAGPSSQYNGTTSNGEWMCRHCTFLNSGTGGTCEMCGLPQ
ncbi:nuclear protein localization protein 4 homolog [Paramacrobiotus metropolitanus]|uniref:nuclear protein localization protein 4 homolog n=1 Tax=Paramacrobiotus metropolitanus TaxID=2943436 RepID=UPI002445B8EF|nr:nuclear protein localization protein 4 homolog [Paramacrobiotus metropolitanus]